MKKYLFLALIFLFALSTKAVLAESDSFNNAVNQSIPNWSNNGSAVGETFICGSTGCNAVKMACSAGPICIPGSGRISKSFSVTPGATYQASIVGGVFNPASGNGLANVSLIVTDGSQTFSSFCSGSCLVSGAGPLRVPLSVTITPTTGTLTVSITGILGSPCSTPPCSDPYADDFVITQTAPAPAPVDASTCLSVTFNSSTIIAGQNYTATVTMKNDGTSTWTSAANYKLAARDPLDDPNWGTSTGADSQKGIRPTRVILPSSISPGSTATFSLGVTAPDTAGDYRFAYQMIVEGVYEFGSRCGPNITVQGVVGTPMTLTCDAKDSSGNTITSANTGQPVTWSTAVAGGTPPFNYSWTGTDNLSSTTSSSTIRTNTTAKTYSTAGTKSATITVNDSDPTTPQAQRTCSVTITDPAPTVTLLANPSSIANNDSSTLSWTTTSCTTANSCSCTASGAWLGSKSIPVGSQSTGNLSGPANYTYTLTCKNNGGSTSLPSTANVSVGGAICPPETNSAFCSRLNKNCGTVIGTDNCGNPRTVTSCGTCSGSQTCGGGGTPNLCGGVSCTPETNSDFCSRLGKNCGSVSGTDNCGNTRTVTSCGICSGSQTCGGGGTPNVCGGGSPSSSGTSPWIQTTGGDVHSNTGINTPGGP